MKLEPQHYAALAVFGAYVVTFVGLTIKVIKLKRSENAENKGYVRETMTLYRMILYAIAMPFQTLNISPYRYVAGINIGRYVDGVGAMVLLAMLIYLLAQGASNFRSRPWLSTGLSILAITATLVSLFAVGVLRGQD